MNLLPQERSAKDRIHQVILRVKEPSLLVKKALAPWQASLGGLLKPLKEVLLYLDLARTHQQLLALAQLQLLVLAQAYQ